MSELTRKWAQEQRDNRFPNVQRVAHFSPRAQMVTLDAFEKDDLPKAMRANDHARASEIFATMSHEITHWADVVGTVWGRGHMRRVYEALRLLDNRNQPGSEADIPVLVSLYDEERRLTFPTYYHVVERDQPRHGRNRPWIIGFSAGQEFDPYGRLDPSRPILFVRFYDHDTQRELVRQPITTGALLETTAVASEYLAIFSYIDAHVPEGERTVERATGSAALLDRLYTPELTLYSAPVHLFAHYAKIGDAGLAYARAAGVAHLCLNLTDAHFGGLLLPEAMNAWRNLYPAFKDRRDRGFAFAVACSNLRAWEEGCDPVAWIDDALRASGLPNAATIMQDAITAMAADIPVEGAPPVDDPQRYMLELGVDAARSRVTSPQFGPAQSLRALGLVPPVFDGLGELVDWPGSAFDFARFDPEKMIVRDFALDGYIKNVIPACR